MKKILDWMIAHKVQTAGLCITIFALPLIIIHILFKLETDISWLIAEWDAGALLAYVAGFETFFWTVALGAVTAYQSYTANKINERLSKENNYIQKISIQQMLPLLRVASIVVGKTESTHRDYSQKQACSVEVHDMTSETKRETYVYVYLPLKNPSDYRYQKAIKLSLENISSGIINQITIDRIEFSGFQYKGNTASPAVCFWSRWM